MSVYSLGETETLMFCARRASRSAVGSAPSTVKLTMPQRTAPLIAHDHAGQRAQRLAQPLRQRRNPLPDRLQPPVQRVVYRRAKAEFSCDVCLPVLEAPRVVAHHIAVWRDPLGGVQVQQRRLELIQDGVAHIEQTSPARAAQELAPGDGEQVAADLVHVNGHLADRLAGVQQVERADLTRNGADLGGGIDQATVRRHMRDGDQAHALVRHLAQRLNRELARLVVGNDLDHRAGLARDLEVGDVVALMLRL